VIFDFRFSILDFQTAGRDFDDQPARSAESKIENRKSKIP